jgi:predicted RNA binding protein YcfA (HicA-like mRNA interferase family)
MGRRITPIHWKDLEKVFLSAGFQFSRQQGSHRAYTREGIQRPVIIPTYTEVPITVIKSNLKTAGISREEYFRLLDNNA